MAKTPVTFWIYKGSLKVEHQAVTPSKYAVSMQDDHKHVQEVNHPRLTETPFRFLQLVLFDLGPGDWLLYWRTPDTAPHAASKALFNSHYFPSFEKKRPLEPMKPAPPHYRVAVFTW